MRSYSGQESGDLFPSRAKKNVPSDVSHQLAERLPPVPHHAMLARRMGVAWKHKWSFISQRQTGPSAGNSHRTTLHKWGGAKPARVRRRGRFFRSGRTPQTVTTRAGKRRARADVAYASERPVPKQAWRKGRGEGGKGRCVGFCRNRRNRLGTV